MTGDEMERAIEFILKSQAKSETRIDRIELQIKETNLQIAHTNKVVEALAETQTEFIQTMLGFVASQAEINTSIKQKISDLTEAQRRTQQQISDLTKAIDSLVNFSSGNGNLPRE